MKFKTITIILLSLTVTNCATLERWHQDWVRENCTKMAAFNSGLADGLKPGQEPNNYANQCPNKEEVGRAYLKGFREGLRSRPQEVNINKVTTKEIMKETKKD